MDGVTDFFLTQGILGVSCLVLGFVILKLYNEKQKLQDKYDALMEARRLDAVETRNEVTSLLPNLSQSLQNISAKIEISKERDRR